MQERPYTKYGVEHNHNICFSGNKERTGSIITDRRYECKSLQIFNIKELQSPNQEILEKVQKNFSFLDVCFRECEIIVVTLYFEATFASQVSVTAYQSTCWNIPEHLNLISSTVRISDLAIHMVTQPFHPTPLSQN